MLKNFDLGETRTTRRFLTMLRVEEGRKKDDDDVDDGFVDASTCGPAATNYRNRASCDVKDHVKGGSSR